MGIERPCMHQPTEASVSLPRHLRASAPRSLLALALLTSCAANVDSGMSPEQDPHFDTGRTKSDGGANGDSNFCSDLGAPCTIGEGDCDVDAECGAGAVCGSNNGANFGMPLRHDVCWAAHCEDGVLSGDETSPDWGGSCSESAASVPVLVGPSPGATLGEAPALAVQVDDADGDALTVRFRGRPTSGAGDDFTVIALPDTQWYTCACEDDFTVDTFHAQTQWIAAQREARNVAFVTQLGDCVEHADVRDEWANADAAMATLEDPVLTGLDEGIPFAVAVGNHDQVPRGDPNGDTSLYNETFGVERFAGRAYYGGHYGENNDNSYQRFQAGGSWYLVVHLEYDANASSDVLAWASGLLSTYEDHHAIVVSHRLLGADASWENQGRLTYAALADHPNLILMLAGHVQGEARRTDVSAAGTVHTLLADYQDRPRGGDGWMRVLTFSPSAGTVHVQTYSPTLDAWETDDNSDFVLEVDLRQRAWPVIGEVTVAAGDVAELPWPDANNGAYEWYVEVDDGNSVTTSSVWAFDADGCHDGAPGDAVFCTADCPCDVGEGDCDNDAECASGLSCTPNVGATYGFEASTDVCEPTCASSLVNGDGAYCSPECPCDAGQGDCDNDAECGDGLVCVMNVGATFGLDPSTDVCKADCHAGAPGSGAYCSPGCPCDEGQGDCDTDADCQEGLTCTNNVGATYGFGRSTDVCTR
jgi:hypothetical protein